MALFNNPALANALQQTSGFNPNVTIAPTASVATLQQAALPTLTTGFTQPLQYPTTGAPVMQPLAYPTDPTSYLSGSPTASAYQRLRSLTGGNNGVPVSEPVASPITSAAESVAPAIVGGAESAAPVVAAEGGGGLLSALAGTGSQLKGAAGALADGGPVNALKTLGGAAKEGFGGWTVPATIAGNIIGKEVGGKPGRVISDASTGAGLGEGILGTVAALAPEEAAAGLPGWVAAGVGAAVGGGLALFSGGGGDSTKANAHAAYSTGWKKIDQLAGAYGVQDDNLISGEKQVYNALLQQAKDPTSKTTQKQALTLVTQDFSQLAKASYQQKLDSATNLALQAEGARIFAPDQQASSNQGDLASAVFQQIAAQSPDAQSRNVANLSGAILKKNDIDQRAAQDAMIYAAPLQAQQQQSLINQYQQQIAALQQSAKANSSTSSGL